MPPARLIVLAERVRDDLESRYGGKPRLLEGTLRGLLESILTTRPPEHLEDLADRGEVRRHRTHLAQLKAFLAQDPTVPEALCARYRYGQVSKSDGEVLIAWYQEMRTWRERPLLAFVVSIFRSGKRVALGHFRGMENALQTSVSNCRAVIIAYRILGSGRHSSANIRLRAAAMVH